MTFWRTGSLTSKDIPGLDKICKTHRSMKRFNHYCLFFRFLHNFFNSWCSVICDSLQLNLEALLKRKKREDAWRLPMEIIEWPGTHKWNININSDIRSQVKHRAYPEFHVLFFKIGREHVNFISKLNILLNEPINIIKCHLPQIIRWLHYR